MPTKWFKIAAVSGALAVALGAFGAHALKASLAASGFSDTYKTAVLYHFLHSLFILAISFSPFHQTKEISRISSLALAGMVCFSGSLYLMTTLHWTWLGPVTPIGGLFFIGAWVYAAVKAAQ